MLSTEALREDNKSVQAQLADEFNDAMPENYFTAFELAMLGFTNISTIRCGRLRPPRDSVLKTESRGGPSPTHTMLQLGGLLLAWTAPKQRHRTELLYLLAVRTATSGV